MIGVVFQALGVAVVALIVAYWPRRAKLADDGLVDLRSRIFDALSDYASREIREADCARATTKYFTPLDVITALEFIEDELDTEIPRSIYWRDTIGEVVDSVCEFAESKIDEKFKDVPTD